MDPVFAGKPKSGIDQMPETPNRRAHHRRAHSDTFFGFPDDILLDDIADFNLDAPSDTSNFPATTVVSNGHFRSLSVDADFFDGLDFSSAVDGGGHHRRSGSMDGSTSSFEGEWALDGTKKAMDPHRLAELALIDPKKAKRILSNRISAARSKQRKVRYTGELERKVQTLQTEATTLSAQVTMLQNDTTGLTARNKELKIRLQAMEKEAHLRDALNEALREEVRRLKIEASQMPVIKGNPFSLAPQYSSHRQAFHHFKTNQTQQSQQLHTSQTTANNQTPNGLTQPSLLDFNQRFNNMR